MLGLKFFISHYTTYYPKCKSIIRGKNEILLYNELPWIKTMHFKYTMWEYCNLPLEFIYYIQFKITIVLFFHVQWCKTKKKKNPFFFVVRLHSNMNWGEAFFFGEGGVKIYLMILDRSLAFFLFSDIWVLNCSCPMNLKTDIIRTKSYGNSISGEYLVRSKTHL